jgi:predicted DNA-binding protein (UPF0251 family)
MEGTPLRSVPVRPLHPVAPADAIAHVAERLPELTARERDALALVDLAGRSRVDAARELTLDQAALSEALATGRKAMRRTLEPLPAGGWCERAERLISNRLDGALGARGSARLDAHLRACERCETHERLLVQARDLLLSDLLARTPRPAAAARRPELSVVDARPPAAGRDTLRWGALVLVAALLVIAGVVIAVLAATGAL